MKKIMIVDDSTTSRLYLKKCLALILPSAALEFSEAANGEEALARLMQSPVDLIISDINMPVMTGETFIKNLKNNPAYHTLSRIPLLFVTSLANEAKSEELLGHGALAVIKKPISAEQLSNVVKPMFGGSDQNQESEWG
jgi:two-component system chemotaxis response regulator CheY